MKDTKYYIELAKQIATMAHSDQIRNNGRPYIEHPSRVAMSVEDRLKPIAWLHDVVEDTTITLKDLEKEGFPPYIISAVDVLTHKVNDSNEVYWKKILTNHDAMVVKLNDIKDNLNDNPSQHSKEKYKRALEFFKKYK